MKAKKWLVLALAAMLAFALVGCGGTTTEEPSGEEPAGEELTGSINVEGSDTMVNLGQAWAEVFQTENPGVMIAIKGGGSGTGIAALINGTIDFANASRQIKDEEKAEAEGKGITSFEIEVAKDGIAVVVNPGNGVTGMTLDQLGKIYRGEITNWKDVGGTDAPIVLLSRDSSSGTYEYFKEEVVGEDNEYAKEAKLLSSTQAIIDETKNNPNAIGYVGLGYLTPDVKVIEIDGVAASVETALDGSYVLSRGLYMYSNGEPADVMKAYIDWILGPGGQQIVTDQGFVPVAQ
ncbi:MAG: phosphate ABC transporter substrate-binding protein [Coriobacteriia bacterium]|nr:phosphate ABC transporter substrate-binding protein [Coriobacteriia bacterium]